MVEMKPKRRRGERGLGLEGHKAVVVTIIIVYVLCIHGNYVTFTVEVEWHQNFLLKMVEEICKHTMKTREHPHLYGNNKVQIQTLLKHISRG